jgi:hypothetical protein
MILNRAASPGGAKVADDLIQAVATRDLGQVLAIVCDLHRLRDPHRPTVQWRLADEGSGQRGLPRPVGPDQSHNVPSPHGGGEALHQHSLSYRHPNPLGCKHLVSAASGGLEPQRHRAALTHRCAQPAGPGQSPPSAFRLGAVLPRDIAADEILLRGDHPSLLIEGALLGQPALVSLADEGLVIAGVGAGGACFQMEHMVNDGLEKGTIVADQKNGGVEASQVSLEPGRGLQVEVVGGLVQQQHVGRRYQLLGQSQPAPLSPAQAVERLGSSPLRIEAEAVKHGIDPGGEGVAALPLESLEVPVVLGEHLRSAAVTRFGEGRGLSGEGPLQLHQLGKRPGRGFPDRR